MTVAGAAGPDPATDVQATDCGAGAPADDWSRGRAGRRPLRSYPPVRDARQHMGPGLSRASARL